MKTLKGLVVLGALTFGFTGCAHMGKKDITKMDEVAGQAETVLDKVIDQGCGAAAEVRAYLKTMRAAFQAEIGSRE